MAAQRSHRYASDLGYWRGACGYGRTRRRRSGRWIRVCDFQIVLGEARGWKLDYPAVRLTLGEHSAIHNLLSDCEMHVSGTPEGTDFGWPNAVVVEPPNLCNFAT